jgi:hypothetical protein
MIVTTIATVCDIIGSLFKSVFTWPVVVFFLVVILKSQIISFFKCICVAIDRIQSVKVKDIEFLLKSSVDNAKKNIDSIEKTSGNKELAASIINDMIAMKKSNSSK